MVDDDDPSIDAKVAFLRRPCAHEEMPARVDVIETHFAWVFVTDRIVRKLKKPIRTDWLNFSTLPLRLAGCAEEVRLNRPLAADVYLGVEWLVRAADGTLRVGGPGRAIDALVRMRRLPAARSLDRIAAQLKEEELTPIAELLAGFYEQSRRTPSDPGVRLAQVRAGLANLWERLASGPLGPEARSIGALVAYVERAADLLQARAIEGFVVDAHGDLRPEHIYLTRPPRVLDRLEFGPALRRIDWLEDLALLAVDLQFAGHGWIGASLTRSVANLLGDRPPFALNCFYRAWRALLRAQLAIEHLDRPGRRPRASWVLRARRYLLIAERYLRGLNPRGVS